MSNDFVNWLIENVHSRGWSYSELARRIDMSSGTISMVASGVQEPSFEFCLGVAKAFDLPPDQVLRRAGLLPSLPPEAEAEDQAISLFRRIPAALRQVALATLRAFAGLDVGDIPGDLPPNRRPRTHRERQAYLLEQELQHLSPEDQDLVFSFMRRLRGDQPEVTDNHVVPVDPDR